MWATSSGSTVSPAGFRCLTASPRWAVFQRRLASGTRRETGPRLGALRPGRSDGKDVLQYPRHLRRVRSRSHPHAHPRRYGNRPRQGGNCAASSPNCPTDSSGNYAACMPRASIPSAISPNSSPSQDQPSIAHSTGTFPLSVRSCPLPESTRSSAIRRHCSTCSRVGAGMAAQCASRWPWPAPAPAGFRPWCVVRPPFELRRRLIPYDTPEPALRRR